MRVLLYDSQAKSYFQSLGQWTSNPDLALDFEGTVRAVTLAYEKRLRGVEIIMVFDDANLNLRLPLEIT